MTRRDLFITLNEPYANAGFIGAEARAERARPGGQLEVEKGFETCTYATAVSKIERLNTAEKVSVSPQPSSTSAFALFSNQPFFPSVKIG